MYGKLAMTCFKYQAYLHGSDAIAYLNAFLWVVTSKNYEENSSMVKLPCVC